MQLLGDTLRLEREKRELLLRQAAAKMEIDQAVLSKIERNERKATREQLDGFSKLYEMSLDDLLMQWNVERVIEILNEESRQDLIIKKLQKHYTAK